MKILKWPPKQWGVAMRLLKDLTADAVASELGCGVSASSEASVHCTRPVWRSLGKARHEKQDERALRIWRLH